MDFMVASAEILMVTEDSLSMISEAVASGKKVIVLALGNRFYRANITDFAKSLKKEGFHIGLATGKKKNGVNIPLEIITGTLSGGGAVLLIRDITERKKMEYQLIKSEKIEIARSVGRRSCS
jgi:hypothetical protein